VVTLERWDPTVFSTRPTATATLTSLVPAQVFDLVRAGVRPPASLRAVVVGGGALAPDLHAQGRALGWPLLPSYGASECASQIATAEVASLESTTFPPLRLLPHAEARTDADGQLEIRSDALFTGYATERGLDDPRRDGWWRTDDLGTVSGRTLTVYGRADDTVKVGGELVNLAALEARLAGVLAAVAPGVDAALVAAPDERLGRAIGLAVATTDAGVVSRVQQAFNAAVLPFERARVALMVSAIPRTPLGKVKRGGLTQRTVEDGRRR
jgi:O-succinylbenzoic acid--CoA ligase